MRLKFKIKKKYNNKLYVLKKRKKNMYQKNHLKKVCKLLKSTYLPKKKKLLKLDKKKSLLHKFKSNNKCVVIIKPKALKKKLKIKQFQGKLKKKYYYSKIKNVKK